MSASRAQRRVRLAAGYTAAFLFVVFLGTAFRTGWTRLSTDFPNYYTAAVLMRQRKPLRCFYNWTWFARQMDYAGAAGQLGAYTPQTPLTMLPMVPLTGLPVLQAKRVWIAFNLMLLGGVIYLLSRVTGLFWGHIALLAFCGFSSLSTNFIYGQYYVFLLFLVTLCAYCLHRCRFRAGGLVSGLAFGLKLYTGPLLFYFIAKRKWGSVAGMVAASACAVTAAIAVFGWADVQFYLLRVLPRTLEGGSIDPYNPGVPTVATLLRRLFLKEPQLNPHPMLDAPWLFFFGHTAVSLLLIAFATLGVAFKQDADNRRDFAWFVIASVLLSTSTASYTYILLLAPVVVLMQETSPLKSVYLVGTYLLLNAPLRAAFLFPKVWLLVVLFAIVGMEYLRPVPRKWLVYTTLAVALLSGADAGRHMLAYSREPGRHYQQIGGAPRSLFSGYPVVTHSGVVYQGMGDGTKGEDAYLLCWLHDGKLDRLGFGGYVLQPFATNPDGPVWFELVAHGTSTMMRFDSSTGKARPARPPSSAAVDGVKSPDGNYVAFTKMSAGSEHVWVTNLTTGKSEEIAGGYCNSSSPAWELDSSAVLFASDCGRAYGLPALYRAPVILAKRR
jgi:Glycosyltransferase family 87